MASAPVDGSGGRRCARRARRRSASTSGGERRGELQPRRGSRAGRGGRGCTGRVPVHERDRHEERQGLTTSRGVDRHRVLRQRAAAVGEGVGDLAASAVQNWTQRRATKIAKKITRAEDQHRQRHERPSAGVQSMSRCRPTPSTTGAWVIRPSRRSANSSAHIWTQQRHRPDQHRVEACPCGSGCPSRSMLPTRGRRRRGRPPVAPYRNAISAGRSRRGRRRSGTSPDADEVEAGDENWPTVSMTERRAVGQRRTHPHPRASVAVGRARSRAIGSATLDHHLAVAGRSTSLQHAEQDDGPADLEPQRRPTRPSPRRLPSQMSAGTWRYEAHGSAVATSRVQPGNSTSGRARPLRRTSRTRTARCSGPVSSSSQNARAAPRASGSPKLTVTASTRPTANAEPGRRRRPGSARSNSSAPTMVGATPARQQVVQRPAEVAGEVPAEQADRPVEVDRDVAGADPLGEVVGGAAAPDRDGHDHRLAEPGVGDRVGGVVAARVGVARPTRRGRCSR